MTIRTDSYGSVSEVEAYTKHLLDGESSFNSTTRPTNTEIEKFIDRASAYVNISLHSHGLSAPVTSTSNSTAALMMDDWVVNKATEFVELTQRGAGYNDGEDLRTGVFSRLGKDAKEFVEQNELGLKRIGVTQEYRKSDGLKFTGIDDQDTRSDPEDSDLEQPMFKRNLFNVSDNEANDEED